MINRNSWNLANGKAKFLKGLHQIAADTKRKRLLGGISQLSPTEKGGGPYTGSNSNKERVVPLSKLHDRLTASPAYKRQGGEHKMPLETEIGRKFFNRMYKQRGQGDE
jgi:hypothetical protein